MSSTDFIASKNWSNKLEHTPIRLMKQCISAKPCPSQQVTITQTLQVITSKKQPDSNVKQVRKRGSEPDGQGPGSYFIK